MSTCKHCGSSCYGPNCSYAPLHEHIGDEENCVYCGSTGYGPYCSYGPEGRRHKHGHGGNKCVWCGFTSYGSGTCAHSPSKNHEK